MPKCIKENPKLLTLQNKSATLIKKNEIIKIITNNFTAPYILKVNMENMNKKMKNHKIISVLVLAAGMTIFTLHTTQAMLNISTKIPNMIHNIVDITNKKTQIFTDFLKNARWNPFRKTAFEYIQEGNLEQLKKIKLDVTAKTKDDYTLLHLAAECNKFDIVEFLLTQGADINAQNKEGNTPLHLAITQKNHNLIDYLLAHGADINAQNKEGETPLHLAIRFTKWLNSSDDIDIMNTLIHQNADINVQNNNGNTPLHLAAATGSLYVIQFLIEHNARINIQNKNGDTPLHLAAKKIITTETDDFDNLAKVKLLIEHEAHINTQNNNGNTPLHLAIEKNAFHIVQFLIENNAHINIQNNSGNAPLHLAIEKNNFHIIQFLIENKADINTQNNNGDAPLHLAVEKNAFHIVQFLIENNAHINTQDNNGDAPLHLAVEKNAFHIIQFLIENKAHINIQNNKGNTPLHKAVVCHNISYIRDMSFAQFLISNGADLNIPNKNQVTPLTITNKDGNTLLHQTVASNDISFAQFLIQKGAHLHCTNNKHETPLTIRNDLGNTLLPQAIASNALSLAKILIENGADHNEVQNILKIQDQFGDTILHHTALINDAIHFNFFSSLNPGLLDKPNYFHYTPLQIKSKLIKKSPTPTNTPLEDYTIDTEDQPKKLTKEEKPYTTQKFKTFIVRQMQNLHPMIISNIKNFKNISFSITNEKNEIENIKILDLLSQHTSPLPEQKNKALRIFKNTSLGESLAKINSFIFGITFYLKENFKKTLYPHIILYKDLTQKALFSYLSQKNIEKNEIENLLQNLKNLEKEVASITVPICMAFLSTLPPMNKQIFNLATISPHYQARLLIPPATNLLLGKDYFNELKRAFPYTRHTILTSTFECFKDGSKAIDKGGVKNAYNQQIFNLFNAKNNSNFFSNPGDESQQFTSLTPEGLTLNPDIILTFKNEEEKTSFLKNHITSIDSLLKLSWYNSFLKSNKKIIEQKNINSLYSRVTQHKKNYLSNSCLYHIKNTTQKLKTDALELFGSYLFYGLVHFQYPTALCAKKYYSALECDYNPENPRMYLEYEINHDPKILDIIIAEKDITQRIQYIKHYSHSFSPQELTSLQSLHDGFWKTDTLIQKSAVLNTLTTTIPQNIVTIDEIVAWALDNQTLNNYEKMHLDTLGMHQAMRDIFSILTASDYAYLFQPQINVEDVINVIEYDSANSAYILVPYDHSLIEKEFKIALESYLRKSPENLSAFVIFTTGTKIPPPTLLINFVQSGNSFAHTCSNTVDISLEALSNVIVNKVIKVNNITPTTHDQNPKLSSIVEKKQDGKTVLNVTIKNHKPIDIPTQQIEDALQEYIAVISTGNQKFTSA